MTNYENIEFGVLTAYIFVIYLEVVKGLIQLPHVGI